MFSTGPNSELGGTNDTACHLDIPMRNCSLFLDDEPIVIDGDIVVKELQMDRNDRQKVRHSAKNGAKMNATMPLCV